MYSSERATPNGGRYRRNRGAGVSSNLASMNLRKPLLAALLVLAVPACHPGDDPGGKPDAAATADGGAGPTSDAGSGIDAGGGTACYIAAQQRCHEFPEPTGDQLQNLSVECSSDSGDLGAACPTASFVGKCTVGTGAGREVTRWYTGADASYEQDFCVNTAKGVWSTTF